MRSSTRYSVMFFAALLVIYLLLLDTLAKPLFESQASEMYGAEISIESLEISPFVGKITLHQLQVADRSNAMRNLVQVERAFIDIDLAQMARDIIDIEQLELDGLIIFADRATPAEILRPLVDEDSDIATVVAIGVAGVPAPEQPARRAPRCVDGTRRRLREKAGDFETRRADRARDRGAALP